MRRLFQFITGILLGGIVAGAFLLVQGRGGGSAEWSGMPLPLGDSAPDFTLLAHDGRTVSLEDFRGRVTVLFFGFTHCPDVCPGTMNSLSRAREQLGELGDDVQVLFITVDPQRDTPERLRTWLANFDPDFLGLTGDEASIRLVADAYGAFFLKRDPVDPPQAAEEGEAGHGEHGGHGDPEDTPYLVDHSGRTFVIDRDGELALTFQPWLEGEGMARDLARLLER